jgi:tetratricopeptide (TPR) repeat protein
VLFTQGKFPELLPYLQDAALRDPQNPDTHHSLGIVLERLDRPDEALAHFAEAIRLNPQSAATHVAIGQALANRGRWEEAEKHLDEAVRLRPDFPEAQYQRGLLHSRRGQWDDAISCLRQAAALNANSASYHCDLAHALAAKGRNVEARAEYQEALRLDPEWPRSNQRRAWDLATNADPKRRRPERALQLAEQVCQAVEHPDAEELDTLAAALAAAGQFDRAAETAIAAAKLATEKGMAQLAEQIRKRLELYERREVYREERKASQ